MKIRLRARIFKVFGMLLRYRRVSNNRVVQMGYCAVLGISQESLEGWGIRGYHNLAQRDENPRNERLRLIAFQNIQKNLNRPSTNIFLPLRKLEKNQ